MPPALYRRPQPLQLLFEVEEGEVQAVAACVKRVMEGATWLSVPLVVDTGWGQNWNDAH